MPDILKITTPVVSKSDAQSVKPAQDAVTAFDLQNIQKVVKPEAQGDLLKQNNGMLDRQEAPTLLMNLLKDPSVTVGFLKNIFMLQEIIQLLPVNNSPLTQEIEQLFSALLVKPEEIVSELLKQENTSTVFKGDLFNFLRELVVEEPTPSAGQPGAQTPSGMQTPAPSPELKNAVAFFLKAVNGHVGNKDILDALANTTQFLSESLTPSKELSAKLAELSARFRQADAPEQFPELKQEVLAALKEVEESILFSPKMQKVSSITVYNLSRYSNNPDFLQEAITGLMIHLDARQRHQFQRALTGFFSSVRRDFSRENSGVMDVLAKIIGREVKEESINLLNADKIEKIIHSLLSSPCNFTPLLHYVVPVQVDFMKAFAEIWINPNGQEDEPEEKRSGGRDLHMLLVFDVEGMGRFEAELYVRGKVIDLSLHCPAAYVWVYDRAIRNGVASAVAGLSYQFGEISVTKLERTRSLMDVFKSLPHKRTGVNVKI